MHQQEEVLKQLKRQIFKRKLLKKIRELWAEKELVENLHFADQYKEGYLNYDGIKSSFKAANLPLKNDTMKQVLSNIRTNKYGEFCYVMLFTSTARSWLQRKAQLFIDKPKKEK